MPETPVIDYASRPRISARIDPFRGVIALAIVFLAGIIFSPRVAGTGDIVFLTQNVQLALFRSIAEFGILAAGMTFVILTAGIDLSVGSVLALSSMTFTYFLIKQEMSAPVALALGIGVGIVCGMVNGALISWLNLQPFVVTLAMMVFARGAARWISNSEKIQTQVRMTDAGDFLRDRPRVLQLLGDRLWSGLPIPFLREMFVVTVIFTVVVLIGHIVLSRTEFGRNIYALGGNELAARYSGMRVEMNKTAAYAICGGLAGMAGILNAAQVEMGDPSAGLYRELDAIAAVVIGGTSLMGGRGSMLLTLLGVLIIGYIETILRINNVPDPWRLMSKGMIIVAAVLIQQRRRG